MINNTSFQYIQIRLVIFVFQSIGPLCTLYTSYLLKTAVYNPTNNTQWPLAPFQCWCAAEAIFFIFFLWYRTRLQAEAIHPPLRSKEDRKALFDKVHSEIHDPTKFLSGWFKGANFEDIGRDDLKEFLSWTFWEGRTTKEDEEELEDVTGKVEDMVGVKRFKPGRGTAKGLRLTLDPIEADWRSLFWYTVCLRDLKNAEGTL